LFKRIQQLGYGIKVPTPFARMQAIVESYGFCKTSEYSKDFGGNVEVWVKESVCGERKETI